MQAGRWRRTGLLGGVAGRAPWAHSHAALPAAERLGRGWRLYVSTRDEQGRARIGCCALTMEPAVLGPLDPSPVLDLGALGAFDDSGVTMSCILGHAGRRYLYYTGWTRGVTVPFYLFAGLAISDGDGRSFSRVGGAPILERNGVDPYLTASPFVLVDNGTWRMWYVSGTGWTMHRGQPRPHYHIKYAESRDGVHWDRDGHVCIDYANDTEHAFARPFVMKDGGLYRMWFAFRGDRYAIGYAESRDGLTWTRRDRDGGLAAGAGEWESEMVEYPWILEERGRTYLLYNGNDYGRSGIGLAVWEEAG